MRPLDELHKFRTIYKFYVFDLSKQKGDIASQTFRLEFKFSAVIVVADYIAYALVLRPELIRVVVVMGKGVSICYEKKNCNKSNPYNI